MNTSAPGDGMLPALFLLLVLLLLLVFPITALFTRSIFNSQVYKRQVGTKPSLSTVYQLIVIIASATVIVIASIAFIAWLISA